MRILLLAALAALTLGFARNSAAQQASPPAPPPPPVIVGVTDTSAQLGGPVGLGDWLLVKLSGSDALDPGSYVLILNGRPITGLADTLFDGTAHALRFHLLRNDANAPAWKALLGSPTQLTVPVTVSLGKPAAAGSSPVVSIVGDGKNGSDKLTLTVASGGQLVVVAGISIAIIVLVWVSARGSTLLKDNLLRQIAPAQQPYSLGRWQMAFWFILIFIAFVTLFALTGDIRTINSQALWLMGISGACGLSAIAVDLAKDTPADAANRALRALGLNNYADVQRVRQEIADRKEKLKSAPPDSNKLTLEIRDRELLLQAYERAIKPFVSDGWYYDLTTDLNGMALHRLQVFCWTWTLGLVFLCGLYTDLTMPQFDTSLLVLLGISNGGYVGFKYPEPQQ
jgi:hypothetical protein